MKAVACALMGLGIVAPHITASAGEPSPGEIEPRKIELDIKSQPLVDALNDWAQQTGFQLIYPEVEAANRLTSPPIHGIYTAQAAMNRLLAGTSLSYEFINERTVAVREAQRDAARPRISPAVHVSMTNDQGVDSARRYSRSQDDSMQLIGAEGRATELQKGLEANKDPSGETQIKKTQLEEIVVTGSHIRGVAPVGSPLIVIERAEIKASGRGRIQDFLETLPQNFSGSASEESNLDIGAGNNTRGQAIDLRGLGASSTLVLVNGRRQPSGGLQGSYVDISSIATSAVERIELLPDGASALYGSDAVGGVVNFVLRKDYDGLETSARAATIDGAAEEFQFSQLAGHNWRGGNILLGYQYSHRDPLMAKDAPYSSLNKDYRSRGGDDLRGVFGNPGTILNPVTRQPAFAIPSGQDGTNLSTSDLLPGQANYWDQVTGIHALPEQTLHSAFLSLSHDLGERIEIFADGRYGQRDMVFQTGGAIAQLSVPSTNPFYLNPFGTTGPVIVAYDFQKDLGGPATQSSDTETYTFALGGIVRLGQQWQLSNTASYGRETNRWEFSNTVSGARRNAALSDPNPATAFNPFGDGSSNNPATIDFIRSSSIGQGVSTVGSFSAIADGPIFRLPGGLAKLAVGVDYRDEDLDAMSGSLAPATGVVIKAASSVGVLERQVAAIFGEAVLPIIGSENNLRWAESVDLSIAGRYEDYSDFGSTFNPKLGLGFIPLSGMKIRGSWGTSFRAPRFSEISPSANPSFAGAQFNIPDPQSPTGRADVLVLAGGNPDLREETADIWTAGLDLTPVSLPGLSVSLTYFSLDYNDKIQAPAGNTNDILLFEDEWTEIISRNLTSSQIQAVCARSDFSGDCPAAPAALVDFRLRNLAVIRVRGMDFDLAYRKDLSVGSLNFGLAGTKMLSYERAVSSTSPAIDVVDTVGYPLALHLRGRMGWSFGQWSTNAFVSYADDYRNPSGNSDVKSWTTVDVGVGYRFSDAGWMDGTSIQLSGINVFDEEPPFVNQSMGFDSANANETGRSLSVEITRRW